MRRLATFMLAIVGVCMASQEIKAQDTVVKKDGETVSVKVFKIDAENIYYRFEGEDLEYQMPKSDIVEITYKSGRKEKFGATTPKVSSQGNTTVSTKFVIEDKTKEFVIINKEMTIEDYMYVTNAGDHNIHISLQGVHYETGEIEQICKNVMIPNDGKQRRIAERIDKGDLDHYTSFKVTVEEGLQEFSDQIIMESLYICFWSKSYNYEYSTTTEAKDYFKLKNSMKEKFVIRIQMFNNEGEVVCDVPGSYIGVGSFMYRVSRPFSKIKVSSSAELPSNVECKVKLGDFMMEIPKK